MAHPASDPSPARRPRRRPRALRRRARGRVRAMSGRLDGKVAIITGASTGLGPVIAKRFVDEGARVLLAARREGLVREAARACGDAAISMRVDVTDEDEVIAMVARAVDEFGQVDVLCNNAAAPGTDLFL